MPESGKDLKLEAIPRSVATLAVFGKRMVHPGRAAATFKNVDIDGWKNNLILRVEPTYSSYTYFWKYYPVTVQQ